MVSKVPGTFSGRARIWDGPIPGTREPGFVEVPIIERPTPAAVKGLVHGSDQLELHTFEMGECNIMLGHEPANGGPLRWHITISCPDRHPTWDEIKTAKYRLTGPVPMAMILPRPEDYVDSHPHVFQLWELINGEAFDAWIT